MTEYKLFKQSMYERTVGFYETYGISVFQCGELMRIVRDVSVDRESVERLISRFNNEELATEHLNQAIEEFLYDLEA